MDCRKNSGRRLLLTFFAVSTAVKLLLIPSYRSTRFEVHRNWLATAHSLTLSKWYFDETSQWTLDYLPFFAYFERFLSLFARLVGHRDRLGSIPSHRNLICALVVWSPGLLIVDHVPFQYNGFLLALMLLLSVGFSSLFCFVSSICSLSLRQFTRLSPQALLLVRFTTVCVSWCGG